MSPEDTPEAVDVMLAGCAMAMLWQTGNVVRGYEVIDGIPAGMELITARMTPGIVDQLVLRFVRADVAADRRSVLAYAHDVPEKVIELQSFDVALLETAEDNDG